MAYKPPKGGRSCKEPTRAVKRDGEDPQRMNRGHMAPPQKLELPKELVEQAMRADDTLSKLYGQAVEWGRHLDPQEMVFAQHIVKGLPHRRAYEMVWGRRQLGKGRDGSDQREQQVDYRCAMTLRDSVGPDGVSQPNPIWAYIETLRQIQARESIILRPVIVGWQMDVAFTPPGEIDKDHYLCQEYTEEVREVRDKNGKVTETITNRKVKMADKTQAVKELARMGGLYPDDATAAEQEGEVSRFLAEIREPGLPSVPDGADMEGWEAPDVELLETPEDYVEPEFDEQGFDPDTMDVGDAAGSVDFTK